MRIAKEPAALAGWDWLMRTKRRVSGRVEEVLAVGFCFFCVAGLAAAVGVVVVAETLAYVDGGFEAWELAVGVWGLGVIAGFGVVAGLGVEAEDTTVSGP